MVMAALTARKSMSDDLGIDIPFFFCEELMTVHENEPHPKAMISPGLPIPLGGEICQFGQEIC